MNSKKASPASYVPTHADLRVDFVPGEYRSSLRSLKAFTRGQTITPVQGVTNAHKAYSSVQCGIDGEKDHIELNSDLVFINHSCEPNVAFDFSSPDRSQWHLRALKDIKVGDTLTFFYPSTEWDMIQAFKCECSKPACLGTIKGAKYLSRKDLTAREFVSPWILELVTRRDANPDTQLSTSLL